MCNDLFDLRDPPIPSAQWRPNDREIERLEAIAARPRLPGRLACELILYKHNIDDRSALFSEVALAGLRQRIDDTCLALAMAPAVDEIDLNIKLGFLANAEPCVEANSHFKAMIMAALEADIARLRPQEPYYRLDRRHD